MNKRGIVFTLLIFLSFSLIAQQALWVGTQVVSPEINPDNTVTFRLIALSATEVKISGDWMPAEGWNPGSAVMVKEDKGIWSYTTDKLSSELYSYFFLVDGLRCPDPNNVYAVSYTHLTLPTNREV